MVEDFNFYCTGRYFENLLKRIPVDRLLREVEEMQVCGAQREAVDEVRNWLDEAGTRWMEKNRVLNEDDLQVLKDGLEWRYKVLDRIRFECLQDRVRRLEGEVRRLKGDFMPWLCYGLSVVCLIGVLALTYYVYGIYGRVMRESYRMDSLQQEMILKRIR